ncbi:hypothetical protein F5B22DRAFT_592720 [Xylaria bambusicola]|uniref:uncharacterized protein n=1 Tax=Xylaria bambusicola TaxID=326684 RepID=UPI002008AB9F|nr:uncharacterized protein F5B22DRAFT_592720 [Xylaria bambusicola]KAI0522077.1 hypothetical protein F5B22DRAFT_592720 [Xylaria bambusicola]
MAKPVDRTRMALKTELTKLAKLSNIEAGLPLIIRGLPAIAIVAGAAIARASGDTNHIEERLLGPDETILLNMPSQSLSESHTIKNRQCIHLGVMMMCYRCGNTSTASFFAPKLSDWGRNKDELDNREPLGKHSRQRGMIPWKQ